jgi:uncharacterized protein YjiS (DUF1127 family)
VKNLHLQRLLARAVVFASCFAIAGEYPCNRVPQGALSREKRLSQQTQQGQTMYLLALARTLATGLRALGALVIRAHAAWEQHSRARAYYRTLQQLDDHTLRDLGFDRSELSSIASELTGVADATRARTQQTERAAPVPSTGPKARLVLRDRSA